AAAGADPVLVLLLARGELAVAAGERAVHALAEADRRRRRRPADRDIGGRRARLQPIGAGLAGAEAGHRDAIGPVRRQLEDEAAVGVLALALFVVIGHGEAAGAAHHQIGIERLGEQTQVDPLPLPAL